MLSYAEVRVPATTANLGPGFDCLGMALDIWNTVRLETGGSGVTITGEGEGALSTGRDNLVFRAAAALFEAIGKPVPQLSLTCDNQVPLGRGSAAAPPQRSAGWLRPTPSVRTRFLRMRCWRWPWK